MIFLLKGIWFVLIWFIKASLFLKFTVESNIENVYLTYFSMDVYYSKSYYYVTVWDFSILRSRIYTVLEVLHTHAFLRQTDPRAIAIACDYTAGDTMTVGFLRFKPYLIRFEKKNLPRNNILALLAKRDIKTLNAWPWNSLLQKKPTSFSGLDFEVAEDIGIDKMIKDITNGN